MAVFCLMFLLSSFCTISALEGDGIDDLQYLAKLYAKKEAKSKGTKIDWATVTGNHSVLIEDPKYRNNKVEVHPRDLEYGRAATIPNAVGSVFVQTYENRQSVAIAVEFTRKVELKTSYSWTSSSKFNLGYEVELEAGVPEIFNVKAKASIGMELASGTEKKVDETEAFESKYILTIPAGKKVTADLVVTTQKVKIPWTADIYITGRFAYWTDSKYKVDGMGYSNTANLHFRDIVVLAPLNSNFKKVGNELLYKAKGEFRGLKGIDVQLKLTEKPIRHKREDEEEETIVRYVRPQLRKLN